MPVIGPGLIAFCGFDDYRFVGAELSMPPGGSRFAARINVLSGHSGINLGIRYILISMAH